jgi:hypothetical protein
MRFLYLDSKYPNNNYYELTYLEVRFGDTNVWDLQRKLISPIDI